MNARNEKTNPFLERLKNYNIKIDEIKNLYVIFEELFIDEDKDIILNYNTQSKEKYINKIHELKDKYKIIEFNDFVMENSDLSQEELENKFKEMTNNRIHINMIFDKDNIFSDIEYVDEYFNNEQND